MKEKVLFLVLLLGAVVALAQLSYLDEFVAQGETRLRKFSSYQELKNFVESSKEAPPYYGDWAVLRPSSITAESSLGRTSALPDYSRTNIQVEGVDEADIVKTDGEFIYLGSGGNITILKAYPAEEAEVLSQITLNGTLKGIYINGDKLAVLEENFGSYEKFSVKTSIKVYDVRNRVNPVSTRNVSLDGHYFDSRMIDDYVYTLINSPAYSYE
ncbi:MAG: beta-propeller domain-containing protein, partial [Candidatus Bathyarchaeia archaeon]